MIRPFFEPPYSFHAGTVPLLISIPHAGTRVPTEYHERLTKQAASLPDTDWHLEKLYRFARELGASMIVAQYSRFLIDINRPEDDQPLYEGATTGLFPTTLFNGHSIYEREPDAAWHQTCLETIWRPYHDRIRRELEWMRREFGHAVLFDAHSIASHLPRLFDGELPHFNIGTNDGASCDPTLTEDISAILMQEPGYKTVVNGRFKGGYITRHYGSPNNNIHAIQLEMAQRCYMEEDGRYHYDEAKAKAIGPLLRRVVGRLIELR